MICVLCGQDISRLRQKPVPIRILEFAPFIGQAEPGRDTLTGMESCQGCYQKVLANRAKAIAEYGKIEDKDAH
jgi:hypothetical protein